MSKLAISHQTKLPNSPLELFVDPNARRTTTRALYQQLREAIATGRVSPGDRLPPSRELAEQLGISRHTITTVYDQLVGEGYLEGRAGGGTFVNPTHTSRLPPSRSVHTPLSTGTVIEDESPGQPRFDLRPGSPDLGLFPTDAWRRCMTAALHEPPRGYGGPAGLPALRETIAHWIGRSRGLDVAAGQIMVTSGAQQAIDLIIRSHLKPGDIVALEEPGYRPVRQLCEAIGADVRPVPVDSEGLVVEQVPDGARLIYTTPAHQFPTGVVMSLPRRLELLEHAQRHDVTIIEDDYDSEYRHVARPLEPLQRLDRGDNVIYVDTFSKTLSPALRLGFAVLPRSMVSEVLELRQLTDWQPAEPNQKAMTRFIADGHLARHLRRTRRIYTERHRVVSEFLVHAVEQHRLRQFTPTCAGLHITATLPDGTDEQEVHRAADREGVAVGDFASCWQSTKPSPGLIIGFGSIASDDIPDALHALSRAVGAPASRFAAVDPR